MSNDIPSFGMSLQDVTESLRGQCHDLHLTTVSSWMHSMIEQRDKALAERDALAAKLKVAESMHMDNVRYIWESRNCGSCGELAEKHDALVATVETLRQSALKCAELVNFDAGTAIDYLIDNHHDLRRQAKETPQQHLRDVRAEAGRAGYFKGFIDGFDSTIFAPDVFADQYAEKVRRVSDGIL